MSRRPVSQDAKIQRAVATVLKSRERERGGVLEPEAEVVAEYPPAASIEFEPNVPIDFHDLVRRKPGDTVEDCIAQIPQDLTKSYAKKWCWNESDEYALSLGCRFDLRRAMHYAYTLRNHLQLWEGEWSEQPFILDSWEVECDLRIFGWVRPSEKHTGMWVRRFAKASTWVGKKNGKSPRNAAQCVYVWRFDGPWRTEKGPTIGGGSHVYCIAKNGIQAGRVWTHSKNMIEHAPLLKYELDMRIIAKNEQRSRLEYMPKHSILTIVTGDNQRARDAAEGLNARMICCDEAAVVDDRMVEVTKDAGASHEDYLWSQISTYGAGEGYGKKDLEYGRNVASGEVKNASYFFKTYEAPQDCSDEDCSREEIWRQANPNLGNTVSIRQMRDAYNECKDDPTQFSGFKQRRLNIWQRASSPMLSMAQWEKCSDEISHEDLRGVGGGLGFDLASTEDWASCAVAWDVGELLKVWVKIWTTEDWVRQNAHRAEFDRWRYDGQIHAFAGAAIEFETVQAEIAALMRHTRAGGLGYDATFGLQMGQNLAKKFPNVQQGKFTQSIAAYAKGTTELRNAVKNGTLRHPNNPALNWQAGHVMTQEQGENYIKPIKPQRDGVSIPYLKIDSIQAICMAIHCKQFAVPRHEPWVGRA